MNADHGFEHAVKGWNILEDPRTNKGTAFTLQERERFGLQGLLPHAVESLDRQAERALGQLDQNSSALEQYIYLTALLDRNETLFYRLVMSDPARFLPSSTTRPSARPAS